MRPPPRYRAGGALHSIGRQQFLQPGYRPWFRDGDVRRCQAASDGVSPVYLSAGTPRGARTASIESTRSAHADRLFRGTSNDYSQVTKDTVARVPFGVCNT